MTREHRSEDAYQEAVDSVAELHAAAVAAVEARETARADMQRALKYAQEECARADRNGAAVGFLVFCLCVTWGAILVAALFT